MSQDLKLFGKSLGGTRRDFRILSIFYVLLAVLASALHFFHVGDDPDDHFLQEFAYLVWSLPVVYVSIFFVYHGGDSFFRWLYKKVNRSVFVCSCVLFYFIWCLLFACIAYGFPDEVPVQMAAVIAGPFFPFFWLVNPFLLLIRKPQTWGGGLKYLALLVVACGVGYFCLDYILPAIEKGFRHLYFLAVFAGYTSIAVFTAICYGIAFYFKRVRVRK